jgi:hypothetical protein
MEVIYLASLGEERWLVLYFTSFTKINPAQLTCRGTRGEYPRVKELVILITDARCEVFQLEQTA